MIRRASPEQDAKWIRDVAAVVYAHFGDYGKILPAWIAHPGVLTFVEEDEQQARRGFIVVGFYEHADGPPGRYIADLLAIAVAPEHQRQGVGKRLLEYAIDVASQAGQQVKVNELQLTVADTNLVAQRMFEHAGFEVLDEDHGLYEGGQRAIRMRRRL